MGSIGTYCMNGSTIAVSKDKYFTATILSEDLISTKNNYSNKTNNRLLSNCSTRQENDQIYKSYGSLNNKIVHSNSECKLPYNPLPFVKIKPKKLSY